MESKLERYKHREKDSAGRYRVDRYRLAVIAEMVEYIKAALNIEENQ